MLPCLPSNEVEIPLQNKVEIPLQKQSGDFITKQSGDFITKTKESRDSTTKQSGDPLQNNWRSTTKQNRNYMTVQIVQTVQLHVHK